VAFGGGVGIMDASESRLTTIVIGCFAVASVAFFVAVYAPALASVTPGTGIKPGMNLPEMLAVPIGYAGWIPCVAMGVRQLFVQPRRYGLVTISFGVLQFATFQLALWLLMGSRGIYWATA
jgi:hypothetical protein